MRKSIMIAAVALLATTTACKKSEPAAEATAEASAAATAEASAAAATAPAAGTYEVTGADGKATGTVEIRADGGYTNTPVKGLAKSGVVKMVDGKTCFDPSGNDAATCYLDSAKAADGSFTATMDDGTVLTVKPKA